MLIETWKFIKKNSFRKSYVVHLYLPHLRKKIRSHNTFYSSNHNKKLLTYLLKYLRHFTRVKKEANFHASNYANFIICIRRKKRTKTLLLFLLSNVNETRGGTRRNTFLRETTNYYSLVIYDIPVHAAIEVRY